MRLNGVTLGIFGLGALIFGGLQQGRAAPVADPVAVALSDVGVPGEMQRRRVAAGRTVVRGPRGGVAVRSGVAVGRPGYRPGYRPGFGPGYRPVPVRPGYRPGGWVRPGGYWWRPGGAIAAGAAIGFVSAAAAGAYIASRPPAPGYCWYYTDPSRTRGFWDVCP